MSRYYLFILELRHYLEQLEIRAIRNYLIMTSNYKKYQNSNPIQQFLIQRFLNTITAMIGSTGVKHMLDVGSGEGFVLNAIFKKHDLKVTALDSNPQALQILKKNLPEVSTKTGDILALPFANQQFELVICCEVLEHLEKPEIALRELKRVSKKYILLSVPNEPWFSIINFTRGKYWRNLGCHPEHIQKWTSKGFVKLVRRQDLKIIEYCQIFPWTIILAKK